MRSPDKEKWLAAMRKDIEAYRVNGTWQVCALHSGKHAIGYKWVFRLKHRQIYQMLQSALVMQGFS